MKIEKETKNTGGLKEYYRLEKEKVSGFSAKQKFRYIWDYYWLWITGIVAAVLILSYVIFHAVTAVKEYWFYGMFVNTFADVGNSSELWDDYVEYTGFDLKEKKVEFNSSVYFDPSKTSGTANSYFQSYVAVTEAGALDVVTMEEEALTALGSSGRLLDLNSDLADGLGEEYRDRLVYSVPYDESYSTEPVPVGIDVSDSILMTKYHLYEESCVLGISAYTKNLEAVELFLKFIYEEE